MRFAADPEDPRHKELKAVGFGKITTAKEELGETPMFEVMNNNGRHS